MNYEKIPLELRALKSWVLWKTVTRDDKPTKLPYQFNGELAQSNNADTWGNFSSINDRAERGGYSGVGFVFSEHDPYCGIDLDGCRNPETGEVAEWARAIIAKLDSYAEISPSKTGVKVWVRGKFPFEKGRKCELPTAPRVCDKAPAIEIYDHVRYFAVTCNRLSGVSPDIEERQSVIDWLVVEYFAAPEPTAAGANWYGDEAVIERARKYVATLPPAVSGQGGHNATFHAACVLVLGFGLAPDQALPIMAEFNSRCAPQWSERELQHKVQSAAKQGGPRNYLRNTREQEWASTRVPSYRDSEPAAPEQSPPECTTLEQAARNYVASLDPGKSNLIELGLPEVDYAIGGGVEAGEMILLASRPSHGKTAAALQVAHFLTAIGTPVAFISEEMSELAMGKRVVQFASDIPQEHWPTQKHRVAAHVDEHFKSRAQCVLIESCRTTQRAAAALRDAQEKHGVKFAVVDYAQLLTSPGKTRYEQVTATSLALRQLASQTGITLLVLCHLSRAIEGRDKFLPTNSDLKDTGQLEQDADVILFLCWPHRLNPKNDPHEFLFFVGKNRNRPINAPSVKCRFEPARQMLLMPKPDVQSWDAWEPAEQEDS